MDRRESWILGDGFCERSITRGVMGRSKQSTTTDLFWGIT